MSGVSSLTLRQEMLAEKFLLTPPPYTSVFVAMTRRVPTTNSSPAQLDEPVGMAYARVEIPLGATDWEQINDNEVANSGIVYFPTATGLWGAMHGWAVIGGTNVISCGTMNDPQKVVSGIRPYLPAGSIIFGAYDS